MTDPVALLEELARSTATPRPEFRSSLRDLLAEELATPGRSWLSVSAAQRRRALIGIAACLAVLAMLLMRPNGETAGLDVVDRPIAPTPGPTRVVPSLGPPAPGGPGVAVAAPRTDSAPADRAEPAGVSRGAAPALASAPGLPRGLPLDVMRYGDSADDGYSPYTVSNGRPNAQLSDPSVDFRGVEFRALGDRRFRVTLTLGGPPRAATQYFAQTYLPDPRCFIYWHLEPTYGAEWRLFCEAGSLDEKQADGTGGQVVIDGNTIWGEFDMSDPDVTPRMLYDAPLLGPSFARNCPDTGQCTNELTSDEARSDPEQRFRWR